MPGHNANCVYNVPMASDMSSVTLGLDPELALVRDLQHLASFRRHSIGPMPMEEFTETFLPTPSDDRFVLLDSRYAFRSVPAEAEYATQIYKPLLSALNKTTTYKSRCPGFVFEDAASRSPHPHRLGYMKPHICCFAKDQVDVVRASKRSSRTEFGYAELFIEVKAHPTLDFFFDPPPGTSADARASHHLALNYDADDEPVRQVNIAFGQHIAYVTEVFARQFRVFYFSISFSGSRARVFRWDRAGCVFSESFDVRQRPELLCDFLWRFSQASPASRGHDVTVEVALPEEEALFRTLIEQETSIQLGVCGQELNQAMRQHYLPGKVTAVHVVTREAPEAPLQTSRFIVSRPVVSPLSQAGRGTRGFWAVDVRDRRVLFLKDTWRSTSSTGLEGETLQHLNDVGVRNVPYVVAHGDVPYVLPEDGSVLDEQEYHRTMTDNHKSQPWVCPTGPEERQVSRFKHYRLVVGPVGYDIRYFSGSDELLHAAYDVLTAMEDALVKDSRLHRDVSVGNIILSRHGDKSVRTGYLIDWESSCEVDDSGEATKPGRAGTWAFMSRRLLGDPDGELKQAIQDDMESLLYVVLYCALHWLPHNLNKTELSNLISSFFDYSKPLRGGVAGGTPKWLNAETRNLTGKVTFASKAIQEWLNTVMNFNAPLRVSAEELKDKWYPDQLDAFWSDFLRTRTLEQGDRVLNEVEKPDVPLESFASSMFDDDSTESSLDSPRPADERTSVPAPAREVTIEIPSTTVPAVIRVTRAESKKRQGTPAAFKPKRTRSTRSMPQSEPAGPITRSRARPAVSLSTKAKLAPAKPASKTRRTAPAREKRGRGAARRGRA